MQIIAIILLALVISVILWLTVFSRVSVPEPGVQYKPFHSLKGIVYNTKLYGIRSNLIGNTLLFMPIGFLVPIASRLINKWHRTLLVGFFMPLAVELTQLVTERGYFDFDDIALNCIGTLIGYGILRLIEKVISRQKRH